MHQISSKRIQGFSVFPLFLHQFYFRGKTIWLDAAAAISDKMWQEQQEGKNNRSNELKWIKYLGKTSAGPRCMAERLKRLKTARHARK